MSSLLVLTWSIDVVAAPGLRLGRPAWAPPFTEDDDKVTMRWMKAGRHTGGTAECSWTPHFDP